jgi:hypothetical protein
MLARLATGTSRPSVTFRTRRAAVAMRRVISVTIGACRTAITFWPRSAMFWAMLTTGAAVTMRRGTAVAMRRRTALAIGASGAAFGHTARVIAQRVEHRTPGFAGLNLRASGVVRAGTRIARLAIAALPAIAAVVVRAARSTAPSVFGATFTATAGASAPVTLFAPGILLSLGGLA